MTHERWPQKVQHESKTCENKPPSLQQVPPWDSHVKLDYLWPPARLTSLYSPTSSLTPLRGKEDLTSLLLQGTAPSSFNSLCLNKIWPKGVGSREGAGEEELGIWGGWRFNWQRCSLLQLYCRTHMHEGVVGLLAGVKQEVKGPPVCSPLDSFIERKVNQLWKPSVKKNNKKMHSGADLHTSLFGKDFIRMLEIKTDLFQ